MSRQPKAVARLSDFAKELAGRTDADKLRSIFNTWLIDKADSTKLAYEKELRDFAKFCKHPSVDEVLWAFVHEEHKDAMAIALLYRTHMLEEPPKGRGLMPTTVNRRLSALRSVVNIARMSGDCIWNDGLNIENVHVGAEGVYKDTRGPGTAVYLEMLAGAEEDALEAKGVHKVMGIRDVVILRFLHDMGLRRAEVQRLNISDVRQATQSVMIIPKGKGPLDKRPKKEWAVPPGAWAALLRWLDARPKGGVALLCSLHRGFRARRLSPGGLNWIVKQRAMGAGYTNGKLPDGRSVSPHGFRHTAITTLLAKSDGNIPMAQDFSRHSDMTTLRRYDDARGVRVRQAQDLLAKAEQEHNED